MNYPLIIKLFCSPNEEDKYIIVSLIKNKEEAIEVMYLLSMVIEVWEGWGDASVDYYNPFLNTLGEKFRCKRLIYKIDREIDDIVYEVDFEETSIDQILKEIK